MNFNSPAFAIFFVAVLFLHSLKTLPWTLRKFNLLICSYIFYAAWRPEFVILIWLSTLVDWFVSKAIHQSESKTTRGFLLVVSIATNLGLLVYFKYGQFLHDNWLSVMDRLNIQTYEQVNLGITLPVGISFYTFQTLSYTFDVYLRREKPWHSFLDYALYVTFFPQLVAGPIVRSTDFLPQCIEPRAASGPQFSWGLTLMLLGLFEKLVVADGLLAPIAEKAFSAPENLGFLDAWFGVFAFAGQVFGDFAGYSTTAIGVAMCLGFTFQDNFRFPYAAIGFSDFWQRWHISLSSWLRDYLYIPLGGNRRGPINTYINLMITMLLGGFWHGASWTFVIWGALHGFYLIVERLLVKTLGHLTIWQHTLVKIPLAICTFLLVCVAWVFFRADEFSHSITFIKTMTFQSDSLHNSIVKSTELLLVGVVTATILSCHWILRDSSVEDAAKRLPWWVRGCILAAMMISIVTMSGNNRAFIYFQF